MNYLWIGAVQPDGLWIGAIQATIQSLSEDQFAYRWRDDDGDETVATWLAAENTDVSRPIRTATRLRVGVNTMGDEPAQALKLQYRKVGASTWNDLA